MFTKNTNFLGRLEETRAQIAVLVSNSGSVVIALTLPPPAMQTSPVTEVVPTGKREEDGFIKVGKKQKKKGRDQKTPIASAPPFGGTPKGPAGDRAKNKGTRAN